MGKWYRPSRQICQLTKAGARIPSTLLWLHQNIEDYCAKSAFRTRKYMMLFSFRGTLIFKQMDLNKSTLCIQIS